MELFFCRLTLCCN